MNEESTFYPRIFPARANGIAGKLIRHLIFTTFQIISMLQNILPG